ncbi:MAG: redoxin domain-containing protein [Planctomycetes bacterium]|nr:redoxin domain-containing protein [Planctomycetota bacterium]
MLLRYLFSVLVISLLATSLSAAEPSPSPIGTKIDAFALQDYRGKEHALKDFKDARLVVVAFVGTECPLAKLYGPKLGKLAMEYEGKGVVFLGIDSNAQDAVTAIAAYARIHEIGFPILKDLGGKVADQFGAKRTPTVFLLDAERVIRYAGRIDDQYGIGFQRDKPAATDLVNAIKETLDGKKVTKAETEAPGCFIGRLRDPKANSSVTYSKHIAPILNHRCVECHRSGEIAPFELVNYKQASGWAETIAEVVSENRMPPWHADAKHGKFLNDRRMSDDEKKLIKEWVAAGAPEGDPKDLPKPPTFPDTGWQLPTKPDLVVNMRGTPYDVPAEGTVKYQYFFAPSGLKDDKWISAVEVMPGNRAVVHHILVFAIPAGGKDLGAVGGGVQGFLAAYVPGLRAIPYPEGMAKRIPAGSNLIFQIHYTPNGSKQKDLSKIGFVFTDAEKVKHEVKTTSAANPRNLVIPPGADNHKVEATKSLSAEGQLLTFMPHMHVRGKAFTYEAILPDGQKETLLDVPQYDFNWQTSYRLAEPRKFPAGTRIHAIAHYDNSEKNLNNPDPKATVRWGDQTWNEMMIGYYDVAYPKGKVEAVANVKIPEGGVEIPAQFKGLFKSFDKNSDGKLDEKEINAMPPFLKQRVMEYIKRMSE